MKLVDKNGRLFGKISVIDVLVVLVVAVMAVALRAKSDAPGIVAPEENVTITYQVKVNALPAHMAEALKVGDPVYEDGTSTNGSLGKVVNVQFSDGTRLATLSNGTLKMVPVEGTVDALVTVEAEGSVDENGIMLNHVFPLGINSSRNFCTSYTQFTGTVVNIEK